MRPRPATGAALFRGRPACLQSLKAKANARMNVHPTSRSLCALPLGSSSFCQSRKSAGSSHPGNQSPGIECGFSSAPPSGIAGYCRVINDRQSAQDISRPDCEHSARYPLLAQYKIRRAL